MRVFLIFLSLCCVLLTFTPALHAGDTGYHVIKKISLGGEGGWDYLTIDSATRRLYVSRSTHVIVLDIDKEKVIGDIPDTPGVHGIALAPEFNRGFTSNGKTDTVTVFELSTLKPLSQAKVGSNPDAIVYDPASKKVFVFNGKSKDATVLDVEKGIISATIPLGGKPEFAVPDNKGMIYVNIEDTNEVIEIDSLASVVTRRFSLTPGEEPSGLALDTAHKRVYSGCHNRVMTVLDVKTEKVIATIPIGEGVDGNGYDPGTGLAFSANGRDGTLTIARETAPGKFVTETVSTQTSARTMAVDPKTQRIYLPAALFGPEQPQKPGEPRKRPPMIPGSFVILVVGK
jgi:DNA-binding beta-propeller fold protein YncE